LIVADSSYIVDGLLNGDEEFGREPMIAPELAVYEVVNAILTRERVLGVKQLGVPYVGALFQVIEASLLEVVGSSEGLMTEAYEIASRNGVGVYDCVFVALALRTGAPLMSHDRGQLKVLEREKARRGTAEGGA
jgi:predicted nucleic acid-binding protein